MPWRVLRIFGFGLLLLSLVGLVLVVRFWRMDRPAMLRQMPNGRLVYGERALRLEETSVLRYTPPEVARDDPRTETQRMMDESMRWWDSMQPKRWEFPGILRAETFVPQTTYGPVGFPPVERTAISSIRVEYFFIPPALGMLIGYWSARVANRRLARAIRGRCRKCGYDLRATPDRCPECGTEAAPDKDL